MDEQLAFYGGAVKALGNGKVGGYLVLFSGPTDPDLEGDYFTKETELFIDSGDQRPILYRHGYHPLIKSQRIGKATLIVDDIGVFVEGELDLRNKYIAALYRKAEEKKDEPFLGWSSGASHLVKKKEVGKAKQIIEWGISEASLTPCPVEPRTSAFPLKSLAVEDELDLDAMVKSFEKESSDEDKKVYVVPLEGLPALKALCEALSPAVNIRMEAHSEMADAAVKELLTYGRVFVEAFKHYRVRVDQHVGFRKERNRKAISDSQEATLKGWRSELVEVGDNLTTVVKDLDCTLELAQVARGEADAAELHAEFLIQQLVQMQRKLQKE